MVTLESLRYLSKRLLRVDDADCVEAARLVDDATQDLQSVTRSVRTEHELFHKVWDHVSRALDHGYFSPEHLDDLEALEAEMAGRVLTARLALGQLIAPSQQETAESPSRFRAFLARFS